jgi:hypothetical protein
VVLSSLIVAPAGTTVKCQNFEFLVLLVLLYFRVASLFYIASWTQPERISAGEDFTSDGAVKMLYHLKRTLDPMSSIPLPPLAITTPPLRRSATGDSSNWSNSWEELWSSSSLSVSFGSDDLSLVVREGRDFIGASSVGDASI